LVALFKLTGHSCTSSASVDVSLNLSARPPACSRYASASHSVFILKATFVACGSVSEDVRELRHCRL
jgi:hypothetical protein